MSSGSSVTSSLTGAIGDAHFPSNRGRLPFIRGNQSYDVNMTPDSWGQVVSVPHNLYPTVAGPGGGISPISPMNSSSYDHSFRTEVPHPSPPFTQPMGQPRPSPVHATPYTHEDEIYRLRAKVGELQHAFQETRKKLDDERRMRMSLSSPGHTPPSSASFRESRKAREAARIKLFCSLNRAGNALCAWHDSRRERRVYPPRNAPPGYLNCGCTYQEALFEESLSRHHVGSYHPGETVRMDPALRNPLLKLLQRRYQYRDGDFEIDPNTGEWIAGEGHMLWEQAGTNRRKDGH